MHRRAPVLAGSAADTPEGRPHANTASTADTAVRDPCKETCKREKELARTDVSRAAFIPAGEVGWIEIFVLDINLSGVYHCSRHAGRVMRAAGGGRIVSTGSANSTLTMPYNAAYTAAKHGVAGLTKALAVDLAPDGIRVNMVAPGLVNTALLACAEAPHVPEDDFERLLRIGGQVSLFHDQPQGVEPEEISQAVPWLASDAARFVTGTTLSVDAGFAIT